MGLFLLLAAAGAARAEQRFTGVWEGGSDGYYLWSGVEWASFNAKWAQLAQQNLRLIDIETYVEGGKRKYIGVWRSGNDGHYLWVGAEWASFKKKWEDLAKQNLRLIDIETYVEGGKRKYTGVWRSGSDGHFLWVGADWASFNAKWNELAGQNLRLIDIETYEEGGVTRYTGVWRAGSGGRYLWSGVDGENFNSKWSELAAQNLRLIDVDIDAGSCNDACPNQVVAKDSYNYGITRTATHCPGLPNTCGNPGAGSSVFYRWPVDVNGASRTVRLSAVSGTAAPFTLPFSDTAVKRRGIWLYSAGSWHHAADYSRDDVKTFAVRAAAPGRVVHVGWDNWSGNTIVVSHTVNGVQDAYRTIYMHLRNGAANDCTSAWSRSVPSLGPSQELTDYKTHLNDSGCKQIVAQRNLDASHWGTNSETISSSLLGSTVAAGQFLAWAGNTGPGGKRGAGGPNTHLHIFFARKDTNNEWYLFDPYGIYGPPNCYPATVTGAIGGSCVRYPVAWKGGKPQYPQ